MTCDIVDGGCFSTVYKYCRTHKCEPKHCPKSELEDQLVFPFGYNLIWDSKNEVYTDIPEIVTK